MLDIRDLMWSFQTLHKMCMAVFSWEGDCQEEKKVKKSNLIATTYQGINKRQVSVFLILRTSISVSLFALVYGQIFYQRIIYVLLNAQIVSVHLDTFLYFEHTWCVTSIQRNKQTFTPKSLPQSPFQSQPCALGKHCPDF